MLKLKALLSALKFWNHGSFPDATLTIQFRDTEMPIPIPSDSLRCTEALLELVRALAQQRRDDLQRLMAEVDTDLSQELKANVEEPPSTAELLDEHEE